MATPQASGGAEARAPPDRSLCPQLGPHGERGAAEQQPMGTRERWGARAHAPPNGPAWRPDTLDGGKAGRGERREDPMAQEPWEGTPELDVEDSVQCAGQQGAPGQCGAVRGGVSAKAQRCGQLPRDTVRSVI